MLYRILTVVMLVALSACEKQYKKSENNNVEVVQKLNSGDYSQVITDLEARDTLTPREKYYLASAYSRSGGVDVFSLYSIMEIQLFHKNALEWSDLSKDKNPYLKFMKTQEGVDLKLRKVKREKKWQENLPDIMRVKGLVPVMTYEEMQAAIPNLSVVTKEEFDVIESDLRIKYVEIGKLELTIDEKTDKMFYIPCDSSATQGSSPTQLDYAKNNACSELKYQFIDALILDDLKDRYLNPEKQNDASFSDQEWEMTLMNVLWNTYEAIPLMRKLPTLTTDQQSELTKSLDIYKETVEAPKFKDVSIKNIAIISGVSLLSLYKESFDLEGINSIQDLYCDFNPEILMQNYGLIRTRLLFLSEVVEKVEPNDPTYQTYRDRIKNLKDSLPETLDEAQKEHYRGAVKEFQLNRCFSS